MKDCKIVNDVMIIDKETSIVPALFSSSRVRKVKFLKGVKEIPFALFSGNTNVKEIEFNNDLKVINSKAFTKCISLTKVIIPESVEKIGKDAFKSCPALDTIACSQKLYEQKDVWLGDNPGTISIVVYDTKNNSAKEVYLSGYYREFDLVGKERHKGIVEEIKNILKDKGITAETQTVREYKSQKPNTIVRRKIDYKIKNELNKQIFDDTADTEAFQR